MTGGAAGGGSARSGRGGRTKSGKPRPGTGGYGKKKLEGKGPTPAAHLSPVTRRSAGRRKAAGQPAGCGTGTSPPGGGLGQSGRGPARAPRTAVAGRRIGRVALVTPRSVLARRGPGVPRAHVPRPRCTQVPDGSDPRFNEVIWLAADVGIR